MTRASHLFMVGVLIIYENILQFTPHYLEMLIKGLGSLWVRTLEVCGPLLPVQTRRLF